jgi:hypothetical protein
MLGKNNGWAHTMEAKQCSKESPGHDHIFISHNGLREARENEIEKCLFSADGSVDWEHFGIIDKYRVEDDIHYAISLLLEKGIFDEKEGYAMYREDRMIKPTEKFWGEKLYFTDEKYAKDFLKSSEMTDVCVRQFPPTSHEFKLNGILSILKLQ